MCLKQITLGKKGLVCELVMVLEVDPVSGFIVSHCMLQDHDFKHLLGLRVGEFALGSEGAYADRQGMDTHIEELEDIREKLIPEMPEMLLSFDSHADSIRGILECLLVLSGVMVPLSIRDWKDCLSSPSNIIFSCFQLVLQSSASSVLMLRASRQPNILV